jgi:hypothetical protein
VLLVEVQNETTRGRETAGRFLFGLGSDWSDRSDPGLRPSEAVGRIVEANLGAPKGDRRWSFTAARATQLVQGICCDWVAMFLQERGELFPSQVFRRPPPLAVFD